jgi:hypothetical protein
MMPLISFAELKKSIDWDHKIRILRFSIPLLEVSSPYNFVAHQAEDTTKAVSVSQLKFLLLDSRLSESVEQRKEDGSDRRKLWDCNLT